MEKTKSKQNQNSLIIPAMLGLLAFLVPATSVNYPSALYASAVFCLLGSVFFLFYKTDPQPFSRLEKAMLISWIIYPAFTALDLWLRTGWIWREFQEPSRFLLVLPIFLMARRVGFSQDFLKWGVLCGAVVAAVWAFYGKFSLGLHRVSGGTSGLIAAFGDISLILGVLTVALFQPMWRAKKRWLLIAVLGLGCGVFASLASGTKGGWISMPILAWIMVDLTENPTYRKRFLTISLFAVVAFLIWFFVPFVAQRVNVIPTAIYEYFRNGVVADGSAGIRLALWHSAALIFWENPLFGTGPDSFYIEKSRLIEAGAIPNRMPELLGPHSQFFNSIVESGIFGPIMVYSIYISFIFFCRDFLNENKALATAGILLAVGFMDFGLVEVIWDINNAGVFYTMMMVLIAGKLSFDRSERLVVKTV